MPAPDELALLSVLRSILDFLALVLNLTRTLLSLALGSLCLVLCLLNRTHDRLLLVVVSRATIWWLLLPHWMHLKPGGGLEPPRECRRPAAASLAAAGQAGEQGVVVGRFPVEVLRRVQPKGKAAGRRRDGTLHRVEPAGRGQRRSSLSIMEAPDFVTAAAQRPRGASGTAAPASSSGATFQAEIEPIVGGVFTGVKAA